jgi:hypothetical protein
VRLSNKAILRFLRGLKLPFSPTSLRLATNQIVAELPKAIIGPQVNGKNKYAPIFLGIVIFVFFFRQSVWHQIYDGKIYDEGFISDLIWRNFSYTTDLIIPNNYLYSHFSPILWIFGCISFLWPWDQVSYFALFFALQPSLTFVALSRLFMRIGSISRFRFLRYLAAFILSVGGASLGALGFPHWEFWAIPLLLFSLDCLCQGKKKFSLAFFVLAVFVKEDVSSYLAICLIGLFWHSQFRVNAIKVGGLLCSLTIIYTGIRSILFNHPSLFEESYLGSPPFSHLNIEFFSNRIEVILQEQLHLFLPIIGMIIVGFVLNAQSVISVLKFASPIFFVSLIAYSPTIGTFQLYYGFSIWIVFILLVFLLTNEEGWKGVRISNPKPYSLLVVCLGIIFVGSNTFANLVNGSLAQTPSLSERTKLSKNLIEFANRGWDIDTAISVPIAGKFSTNQLVDSISEIDKCTIVSNTATQFSQEILREAKRLDFNILRFETYSIISPKGIECTTNPRK